MPVYSISATAAAVLSTQPAVSTAAGSSHPEADILLVVCVDQVGEDVDECGDRIEEVKLMKVGRRDDLKEVMMEWKTQVMEGE